MSLIRHISCISVLALLTLTPSPSATPAAGNGEVRTGTAASLNPSVRLRKLHLVRPDLIPYPIAYEIYC